MPATHIDAAPAPEAGFSLIELMFALGILLIVAAGILPLGMIAVTTTENQGHLMARTTEYAQDKLEQLLVLSYGDVTSDTRVFPAADVGGSGLAIGGSSDPAAPVALYVDYLDINGNLLPAAGGAAPANWFYQRVWQIEIPAGFAGNAACTQPNPPGCLKQVTVTATVSAAAAGGAVVPRTTVTALKTFPF
jgi:prepilin-type N-terminal cleavage/methylation domain-containing protein